MQKFLLGTIFVLLLAGVSVGAAGYPQEQCRSPRGGYCASLAGVALAADTSTAQGSQVDVGGTIAKFYTYGLSVVGLAALIMFVYSGILYMIAGENTGLTGQARKFMTNAIWGLILALISWLILFTINPDLVKQLSSLDLLPKLSPVTNQTQQSSTQILDQAAERQKLINEQQQGLQKLIDQGAPEKKKNLFNTIESAKVQLTRWQQQLKQINDPNNNPSYNTPQYQNATYKNQLSKDIENKQAEIKNLQNQYNALP